MDFFVHHDFLDSTTKVYSSVYEISNHSYLDCPCVFLFLFHPTFPVLFFLSLLLFRGGRLSLNLFIYQPPTIACNNDWCFSFGIYGLGISTGILWKRIHIKYIHMTAF